MLNGKFFTGLPEKMMNRGTGPDRQKTNLYWPEEADSPSIHEYSPSKNSRSKLPTSRDSSSRTSSVSYDSQNSCYDNDVNTREMVRKQQESKIQFYDYDDTFVPPSRSITPSSVAKNLSRESPEVDVSNRKLKTLQSRIEFYDYVDEDAPQPKNRSPQHNNTARGGAQLKSESETRSINKSKDGNFIQGTYAPEDRTDGHHDDDGHRRPINRMHKAGQQNLSQKSTTATAGREIPIHVEVVQQRPVQSNMEHNHSSSRPSDSSQQRLIGQQQRKQLSSSVIDLSTLDLNDPELEDLKKLKQPPSIDEINKKLSTFRSEIKVSTTNSRTKTSDQSGNSSNGAAKSRPPTRNNFHVDDHQSPKEVLTATPRMVDNHRVYDDEDQHRRPRRSSPNDQHQYQQRNRDPVSPTSSEGAPNEARRNAHRHLESSFSLGGAPQPRRSEAAAVSGALSGARRSYSIRDTAVGRVGVGLPDL